MTITSARSTIGMTATGEHSGTNQAGTCQIGIPQQATNYASANVAYALKATLAVSANTLLLTVPQGTASGTTWVAGAAQIETATVVAASGCTSNGNCALTLTSGVVTGASGGLAITVALTTASDTAAKVATALSAGLNANSAVSAHYVATTSTADVILTRKVDANGFYQAADATLNLAIPAGIGITAAATSAGTVAGTATSGTLILDGDGNDFEGIDIPTIATLNAIHFDVISGSAIVTAGITTSVNFPIPAVLWDSQAALLGPITITAESANTVVRITVVGQTT